jgi:hypothetical protein
MLRPGYLVVVVLAVEPLAAQQPQQPGPVIIQGAAAAGVARPAMMAPLPGSPQPASAGVNASLTSAGMNASSTSAGSNGTPLPASGQQPLVENLISFDPMRVEVAWQEGEWKLLDRQRVLKTFGKRQEEAREALRLIRDLRLNQFGTVGAPVPMMEYWLCSGAAPQGVVTGLRSLPIDLPSLRVEAGQRQNCLRDSQRILFNFGQRVDLAQQALAVLQKYRFNKVVMVGQAAPSMMVFVSTTTELHQTVRHDSHPALLSMRTPSEPGLGGYITPAIAPLRLAVRPDTQLPSALVQPQPAAIVQAQYVSAQHLPPGFIDNILRVPFDWRLVELVPPPDGWCLRAGGYVLAHFGTDERSARQAQQVIQFYRFTEHHLVGYPATHFTFLTVGGQVPHSDCPGVHTRSFDPDQTRLAEIDGRFVLCYGDEPLIPMEKNEDEARQLLEVIKHHHCDHLCWVGENPATILTFFTRSR